MRKTWTDADAQQLKALRELAGTALPAFAQRHALSAAQVRELEGGKTGSFYSDDIKAHTGRRLLAALGYVAPPEPLPAPPAPPAIVVAAEPPAVSPPANAADPVMQIEPQAAPSPAPEDSVPPPTPVAAVAPAADAPGASAPTEPAAPRRLLGPLSAGLALAAIGAVVFLATRAPSAVAISTVTVQVEPSQVVAAAASAPAANQEPAAQEPAALPASAASGPLAGCEAPSAREATRYQSPGGDKPATYVHVESTQAARLCVLDGKNQTRVLALKAGEPVNVMGTAPFTIRTSQWNDLRVYFEGRRVQLEPGVATDNVVILARP